MKTKRKVFILLIGLFLTFLSFVSTSKAEVLTWWGKFGSDPENIAKTVAELANDETSTRVQDTKLDWITNITAGSVSHQYQISNTLIRLSNNENWIMPYIQWTLYIWLVWATILLIWNWFLLVTGKKLKDAQENIKYILLWVIIMTWFYAIIEVISAILNFFFS
jgi:hypothetical protein